MPTYKWDTIAADGYRYPREKLRYAENFYDILRVDHVVGLFRIWSIPYNDPPENEGLNGIFDPKDEKEWNSHGRTILSMMLEGTKMLLAAEDLGMIPKECPKTLAEFEIPGNDVQRWVKDWSVKHDFLPSKEYRAMSVSMLSTHDTTNWAAWWENEAGTVDEALFIRKCADRKIDYAAVKERLFDPALSRHGRLRWLKAVSSKEKYVEILGKRPEELADFIEMYENTYMEKEKLWKQLGFKGAIREGSDDSLLEAALTVTLESKSVFAINLIFDWLMLAGIFKGDPYAYRVNTPGTISEKNWSLTVPMSLEGLLRHKITSKIREMVASSGRR
jgi:4-alpha-glucanotransferase